MPDQQMQKVVIVATHGPDDPELATLPFMMGTAAQVMEMEAVIVLQGAAVMLASKACHAHVMAGGLPALEDQVDSRYRWQTPRLRAVRRIPGGLCGHAGGRGGASRRRSRDHRDHERGCRSELLRATIAEHTYGITRAELQSGSSDFSGSSRPASVSRS